MNRLTKWLALSALAITLGMLSPSSASAAIPEVSYLPVEEPLDVGGTILEPGVYVIRVLPLDSTRNMLQVTNEDRTKIFATVLSIPHALPATEEQKHTKFVFYPASNGAPRALRTWFAPDSTSDGGHDIVYPERRAMQIASVAMTPVVAYKDETPVEELKSTQLEVVTPDQKVTTYVEQAPTEKVASMAEGSEMPRTAGNGPLLLTLGLMLVVGALGMRALRSA